MDEIVVKGRDGDFAVHYVLAGGDDHGSHSHDEIQIFIALGGHGFAARLAGGAGQTRRVRFDAGVTHVLDRDQEHRFDWAVAEMTSLFVAVPAAQRILSDAFGRPLSLGEMRCVDDPLLQYFGEEAGRLARRGTAAMALDTVATAALVRLGERSARRSAVDGTPGRTAWIRVLEFIDAHLDGALTLRELAAVSGVPQHRLARWFIARTGVPPHRWIRRRRLARAKVALSAAALPTAAIAAEFGFAHQSHFTEAFRAAHGTTPGRYRSELAPSVSR